MVIISFLPLVVCSYCYTVSGKYTGPSGQQRVSFYFAAVLAHIYMYIYLNFTAVDKNIGKKYQLPIDCLTDCPPLSNLTTLAV